MSSYIPPHMRNRNKERKTSWKEQKEQEEDAKMKKLSNTDENFPSLGGSGSVKKSGWGGSKTFATLATEWKKHENEQKAEEERQRLYEIRTRTVIVPYSHRSEFNPIHEETYDDVDESSSHPEKEEDEWTMISKKVKPIREKTIEELDQELEDERRQRSDESDTMWGSNQPQEYETYWDERRG